MDKGTGVGWRSALMAPVCFVIRSSVKRCRGRNGGGQTAGKEKETERERKSKRRTDTVSRQTDRIKPRERKKDNTEKKRLGAN